MNSPIATVFVGHMSWLMVQQKKSPPQNQEGEFKRDSRSVVPRGCGRSI